MFIKILVRINKCLTLVITHLSQSKNYDDSNKLVGKMIDKTAGVVIK